MTVRTPVCGKTSSFSRASAFRPSSLEAGERAEDRRSVPSWLQPVAGQADVQHAGDGLRR